MLMEDKIQRFVNKNDKKDANGLVDNDFASDPSSSSRIEKENFVKEATKTQSPFGNTADSESGSPNSA